MTTEEFKILKPEYRDMEGPELWDAMTDHMLRQQQVNEIAKVVMPFWKTHTLRWLFYRRIHGWRPTSRHAEKYKSHERCVNCKNGVGSRWFITALQEDGSHKCTSYCPHCHAEYHGEPNTNLSHRAYIILAPAIRLFWAILDKIHLIRSSHYGRYDMFGDEARYVKHWVIDENWQQKRPVLKSRKWWEYVFAERKDHNL